MAAAVLFDKHGREIQIGTVLVDVRGPIASRAIRFTVEKIDGDTLQVRSLAHGVRSVLLWRLSGPNLVVLDESFCDRHGDLFAVGDRFLIREADGSWPRTRDAYVVSVVEVGHLLAKQPGGGPQWFSREWLRLHDAEILPRAAAVAPEGDKPLPVAAVDDGVLSPPEELAARYAAFRERVAALVARLAPRARWVTDIVGAASERALLVEVNFEESWIRRRYPLASIGSELQVERDIQSAAAAERARLGARAMGCPPER